MKFKPFAFFRALFAVIAGLLLFLISATAFYQAYIDDNKDVISNFIDRFFSFINNNFILFICIIILTLIIFSLISYYYNKSCRLDDLKYDNEIRKEFDLKDLLKSNGNSYNMYKLKEIFSKLELEHNFIQIDPYINNVDIIVESIKNLNNTLIIGLANSGKTRLLFESLSKIKNDFNWKNANIYIPSFDITATDLKKLIPAFSNKQIILFDNIELYQLFKEDYNFVLSTINEDGKRYNKDIIILGAYSIDSIRADTNDLNLNTTTLNEFDLQSHFSNSIILPNLTIDKAILICSILKLEFNISTFDHSIGSLLCDIQKLKDNLRKCLKFIMSPAAKKVLGTLKLLYQFGVREFRYVRVIKLCRNDRIFEGSFDTKTTLRTIDQLKRLNIINTYKRHIIYSKNRTYQSYITINKPSILFDTDFVATEYTSSHLDILINFLFQENEYSALSDIGNYLFKKSFNKDKELENYLDKALHCYKLANTIMNKCEDINHIRSLIGNVITSLKLGDLNELNGKIPESLKYFEEALRLLETVNFTLYNRLVNAEIKQYYALICYKLANYFINYTSKYKSFEYYYNKSSDICNEIINEYSDIHNSVFSAHYTLVELLLLTQKYDEALEELKQLETLSKNNCIPYLKAYALANKIYNNIGETKNNKDLINNYITEAKNHFIEAMNLKENNLSAAIYNNYGYFLQKVFAEYDEAIIYYKKALYIEPKFYLAKRNLARCYINKNDNKKALSLFDEILMDNPSYNQVKIDKAYLLTKSNEIKEASGIYLNLINERDQIVNVKELIIAHRGLAHLISKYPIFRKEKNLTLSDAEAHARDALKLHEELKMKRHINKDIYEDFIDSKMILALILEKTNDVTKKNEAEYLHKETVELSGYKLKYVENYVYYLKFNCLTNQLEEFIYNLKNSNLLNKNLVLDRIDLLSKKFSNSDNKTQWLKEKMKSLPDKSTYTAYYFKEIGKNIKKNAFTEKDITKRLSLLHEAKNNLEAALAIDDEYPSAKKHLAVVLAELGEYDKAYKLFQELLILDYPKGKTEYKKFIKEYGHHLTNLAVDKPTKP